MAQPLRWKRKIILAKTEGASPGVDATPVVATDAMLTRNFKITPLELQADDRALDLMYVGNQGKLIFGKLVRFDFDVELQGSAAAGTAPGYAVLLKSCCLGETIVPVTSVTYAPVNPGAETTMTMYFYMDGKLYKALFCIGNVEVQLARGKIPFLHFTFMGIYAAVSDAALSAPTLTAFKQPLVVSNTNTTPCTIATYAAKISEFKLATGNVLTYRNLIGSEAIRFTDRSSTGSVKFEEEKVATKDFHALVAAGTLSAISILHGTAAGSKVTIAAANAQLVDPGLGNEDNIAMTGLNFICTPSTAGNDEFSIAYT